MVEKQTLIFCPDAYQGNTLDMWQDISKFLEIVIKNENICTIKQEDFGIIVVDYEHDESIDYWGVCQPLWLTPDEQEAVEQYRSMRDDTKMENPEELN